MWSSTIFLLFLIKNTGSRCMVNILNIFCRFTQRSILIIPLGTMSWPKEMNSGILPFLIGFVKYITFCPTNIHHWCMFLISHSQFYWFTQCSMSGRIEDSSILLQNKQANKQIATPSNNKNKKKNSHENKIAF